MTKSICTIKYVYWKLYTKIIVHVFTFPILHCLDTDLHVHVHSSFMTYQAMNYGGDVDCHGTS